ncbi:hypothetical protein BC826DRAFT_1026174 [Russula brevipes]|nr:hypothetical protein BC826DRAFT_1026174 [Russula brevipes]
MSNNPARLSTNNPFRAPAVTPTPTGASAASTIPPYSALPPLSPTGEPFSSPPSYSNANADPHSDDEESPEVLPDLTPRIPSARPPAVAQQTRPSIDNPPPLPPRSSSLYQPPQTAPPSSGVAILPPSRTQSIDELLPNLSLDTLPETAPPAYSLSPDVGGGETLVQQGPRRPFQRAPQPFLEFPTPAIPQQNQGESHRPQPTEPQPARFAPPSGSPNRAPERPLSQMSDFPQDSHNVGATTSASAVQEARQPRFAPPPGAPPPPRRPRAASTSSGAGSTAPPTSDGRPTTTPTPGHPLLRNGQTLVYPETYSCSKCQNTGYKSFDPSHPCRKCWDRFGKPFTSILASSPWGGQGHGSTTQSQRGRSFQRPLPAIKAPQVQQPPPRPRPPPTSTCRPPPGPHAMQNPGSHAVPIPYGTVPPIGSTVVMPGDPRIGGRLCWRCGGRGVTPFLIFDEMPCETCGGVGRLLN